MSSVFLAVEYEDLPGFSIVVHNIGPNGIAAPAGRRLSETDDETVAREKTMGFARVCDSTAFVITAPYYVGIGQIQESRQVKRILLCVLAPNYTSPTTSD